MKSYNTYAMKVSCTHNSDKTVKYETKYLYHFIRFIINYHEVLSLNPNACWVLVNGEILNPPFL